MKPTLVTIARRSERIARLVIIVAALCGLAASVVTARADETCSSPYLARIEGQEEFVYVWTLGVEGLGDGSDKLVVVDVKPGSPDLRQGHPQPLGRRTERGASRRIHR